MKEKLKNKKVVYTIIGIVSVLLVMLAVTYAYWLVTKTQTGENEISSACLDISISGEKNDITLTNQFPMSDEDGMKLVPYEFTVTNNCNTSVDYQVALEATGTESSAMATSSIKVGLNDEVMLLGSRGELETTIEGAYESRIIGFSRLTAKGNDGSSATYKLRIWIDENAPISEMNKTFTSKISVTVGQGIENPYEEGTLAYDILANYGGGNTTINLDNSFDHTIISNKTIWYLADPEDEKEYFGTDYVFDETTKKYTLTGEIVLANWYECKQGYHVTLDYDEEGDYIITQGDAINCGKYTLQSSDATYSSSTLYEAIDIKTSIRELKANVIKYVNSSFATNTNSGEFGLYKTQDDLGDSYYFRGDVTNNYVQFGAYSSDHTRIRGKYKNENLGEFHEYITQEECETAEYYNLDCVEHTYAKTGDPMYWRIVRINGDGTIRLIYDGTAKSENGSDHVSNIGYSTFNYENANELNSKYMKYTYDNGTGTQVDSTIKNAMDIWYDAQLKNKYDKYIADGMFCHDLEISGYIDGDSGDITSTKPSGEYEILYKSRDRLNNFLPTLKCPNKNYIYTVNDTVNGNGYLSNPVGLITADEAIYAGAIHGTQNINKNFYLYSPAAFFTLTPYMEDWGDQLLSTVNINGRLTGSGAYYANAVRPVINLKVDVKFTGNGTIDNPYKIVTE